MESERKVRRKYPDAKAVFQSLHGKISYSIWISFKKGISDKRISQYLAKESAAWDDAYKNLTKRKLNDKS